jgi:hypothetical protein
LGARLLAARRRRLELRGREPIGALPVRHDHQRARRSARVRVPLLLALRGTARPRLLPPGGRDARTPHGRGRRHRALEAAAGRALAARSRPPGRVHLHLEGDPGTPSRWITLRALRVLAWWDDAAKMS